MIAWKKIVKREVDEWDILMREADTLRKREHPNIVALLASFTLNAVESEREVKSLNLLFPYAELDLERWMTLQQAPQWLSGDRQRQRAYLYQAIYSLVSALAFLHREIGGVITSHHDLKPKNILVIGETLKICDFGRSHLIPLAQGSDTEGLNGLGTFTYQPPEYWNDDGTRASRRHGRAFDIWTMGCIVVELAALIVYGWECEQVKAFRQERISSENGSRKFETRNLQGVLDDSFHNHMDVVHDWMSRMKSKDDSRMLVPVLAIADGMLKIDPEERLYSWEAELDLYELLHQDHPKVIRLEKGAICVQPPGQKSYVKLRTPVHRASIQGNRDRLVNLLKVGWPADEEDSTGNTPSQLAELNGHSSTRDLLVNFIADQAGDASKNVADSDSNGNAVELTWGKEVTQRNARPNSDNEVPKSAENFFGREDILKKIFEYLKNDSLKPTVVVLHGLGGIGKTEIMQQFAKSCEQNNFLAFWIDANSQAAAEKSLKKAAVILRRKNSSVESNQDDILYFFSFLRIMDTPWVLLFDNANNPALLDEFDSRYIPKSGNGNIIITTQHKDFCELGYGLEITGLDEVDSVSLLLHYAKRHGSKEVIEATKIVRALDNHPLALIHAGSYIHRMKIPTDRYLSHWKTGPKEILNYRSRLPSSSRSTASTMETSFEALKSENSKAANWLLLCTFFDRKISQDLFRLAFSFDGNCSQRTGEIFPSWLQETATVDGTWDEGHFSRMTADIHLFSLVEKSTSLGSSPSFLIHPVVQEWGKSWVTATQKQELTILAVRLLELCLSSIETVSAKQNIDPKVARYEYILHIDACYKNAKDLPKENALGTAFLATAAQQFVRVYSEAGRWKMAEELQQRVVANYDKQDPLWLSATLNLAALLRKLDRCDDALDLQQAAINRAQTEEDTLRAKNDLSSTYRDQNNLVKALEIQTEVVQTRRGLSGQDGENGEKGRRTLQAMASLAVIYDKMDRLDETLDIEQVVLRLRRSKLGENNLDTINAKANLAATYWKLERYAEAEPLELEVRDARRRLLGDDHWETIRAEGSLSATYRKQGRLQEAEATGRKVLDAKLELLGRDNPSTRRSLNNLCKILVALQRDSEASDLRDKFDVV